MLNSGIIIYWEHLGRLTDSNYKRNWEERKKIFEEIGDMDNLVTTDELYGINDKKIEEIVNDIINDRIDGDDIDSKFSKHHYSLNFLH